VTLRILAFDTCLGAVSVAAGRRDERGEWSVHSSFEQRSLGHAERLMPMITETMQRAGLAFADLDRIAATIGPGSFTGVRIGVAAARGFGLATGRPVVGVGTLAAMAEGALFELGAAFAGRALVVAVDARRERVYVQVFDADAVTRGEPAVLSARDAAQLIGNAPTVVVGSGAAAVVEAIHANGGAAEARLHDLQPHAINVAHLAADLPPSDPLRPLYLRPPDVKPQADPSLLRARS
jgi:tRNA threonylcarbamoyladenosine biosynthesis protein TsaB